MSSDVSFQNLEPTDRELLKAMAEKHQWALAQLYDRYSGILYALTLKILEDPASAQEALHDVFLIAWHKAASYDHTRGQVSAWLIALCRNLAIDRYRIKMRLVSRRVELEQAEALLSNISNPEAETLAAEDSYFLRIALEKLPCEQRQMIELAYFRGMSQQEIATVTHTPIGTVKTRIRQAIKRLRDSLSSGVSNVPI
jgi:RNA polymerase sigma-70 factor (ECF subfamily)